MRTTIGIGGVLVGGALLGWNAPASSGSDPGAAAGTAADELAEITVDARAPRFVAPTRRDAIGRIWAPVFINRRGPFRLVLDTGASHSGVTALVAELLGLPTDRTPPVMLKGVTGFATVPTIRADSLSVGELLVASVLLPIVPDALGGAEGVLGAEGLKDKRISIDFRRDQITIAYSRNERSGPDFVRVPFRSPHGALIIVDARVGGVPTRAIIDTGGQVTIANLALRAALDRMHRLAKGTPDQIMGATRAIEDGEMIATPAIEMGSVRILDPGITFADLYIFKQWRLIDEPAIVIGMDALGVLDALIIDYRQRELQLRTPKSG